MIGHKEDMAFILVIRHGFETPTKTGFKQSIWRNNQSPDAWDPKVPLRCSIEKSNCNRRKRQGTILTGLKQTDDRIPIYFIPNHFENAGGKEEEIVVEEADELPAISRICCLNNEATCCWFGVFWLKMQLFLQIQSFHQMSLGIKSHIRCQIAEVPNFWGRRSY